MTLVFSDGVNSLVYVGDTSFVLKCLSPAVCSVFLCWCVDWNSFFPINFIYPPLPFIMLVIVFVDSTMGCSISITITIYVSLPRPLIQHVYVSRLGAPLYCCSPFTGLCSSTFVVFKSFCAQFWKLNGLMPHISIHHVNRVLLDVYYPVSSFMFFSSSPNFIIYFMWFWCRDCTVED
ncbi:hypothetical protein N665_0322s0006 [Sinapis alba]|nr:hypothetical protein N665_0322s0006 [Sinapis alba]